MRRLLLVVLVALVALVGCAPVPVGRDGAGPTADASRGQRPPSGEVGTVVRVVDGDTVHVRTASERLKVRLIGVDTPETVHPRLAVQCFGREAAAFMRALLDGERVRLERDVDAIDRYGRTLAYVYRIRDGLFVNHELVSRGYATVLTVPPNVAHADELVAAERNARGEGRGMWRACALTGGTAARARSAIAALGATTLPA